MQNQTRCILLFLAVFCAVNIASAINSANIHSTTKTGIELVKEQLSIDDFLQKDRREIEMQIGTKLTLKERLILKILQKNISKAVKQGESKEAIKQDLPKHKLVLNPAAFFLGVFLLPLGVLIVYLFFKKDKKQARQSAWIGLGFMALLMLLLLLAIGLLFFLLNDILFPV